MSIAGKRALKTGASGGPAPTMRITELVMTWNVPQHENFVGNALALDSIRRDRSVGDDAWLGFDTAYKRR